MTHLLARVAVGVHRALLSKLCDGEIPVTSKPRRDAKAGVSMSNTRSLASTRRQFTADVLLHCAGDQSSWVVMDIAGETGGPTDLRSIERFVI